MSEGMAKRITGHFPFIISHMVMFWRRSSLGRIRTGAKRPIDFAETIRIWARSVGRFAPVLIRFGRA